MGHCAWHLAAPRKAVAKWEADRQPVKISLGLLPSGPDPVGEHNACRQPPGAAYGGKGRKRQAQGCQLGLNGPGVSKGGTIYRRHKVYVIFERRHQFKGLGRFAKIVHSEQSILFRALGRNGVFV